jgi:hypothetical protein
MSFMLVLPGLLLFAATAPLLADGESLLNETTSLEHAWYAGLTFNPYVTTDSGSHASGGIRMNMEWEGRGVSLESMYFTGLYWEDRTGSFFCFTLNTSLGVVHWERRVDRASINNELVDINIYTGNRGYTGYLTQKVRAHAVLFKSFGTYIDGGFGAAYHHPLNIPGDERAVSGFRIGPAAGIGMEFFIQSYTPLALELGVEFQNFLYVDPDSQSYLFAVRFAVLLDVW